MGHLLKWQFQPQKRTRSWWATLRIQRREVQELLSENPSLKPQLSEFLAHSYETARDLAIAETELPPATFPLTCPYELSQIIDSQFFPGDRSPNFHDE
ncbi:MAG: DUF29 domain-containing protein [Synechococcales bacterium]|nr:DUF29 domain-containing protein [Synechococcales bacterium]